jgi:hypothetical protein
MEHKRQRQTIELMGLYEIAQVAGVTPQAVSNWVTRKPTFPKPLALLASGAVWDGGVIRTWLAEQQLSPEGTGDRRVIEQFVAGQEYTFNEVAQVFGGQSFGYLPQVGSRIVCGRFTLEMNPRAPYEVLVGDPPGVLRKAELLVEQDGVIPVFIKAATNRWRYHGPMEVVGFNRNPRAVRARAKEADREDVVGILLLRDAS